MEGPPPGVDLSSLSVTPNIITQKKPQMPKINRNDGPATTTRCRRSINATRVSSVAINDGVPVPSRRWTRIEPTSAGGRLDSRGAQTGTKHSYATSEVRADAPARSASAN